MLPGFLSKTSTTKTGNKETHLHWWVTLLLSLALSIGTWNPSGHHFVNYIASSENLLSGFKPFFVLIMLALWLLAIKSIFQSLKLYGAILAIIILGAFIWGLQQYGIIDVTDLGQAGWIATIGMGILIWLGLTASVIWKKITGVYTTDLTEEN